MWVSKSEIQQLSDDVRRIIDGQAVDIRDNREGALSILKNDIHTLAGLLTEQVDALRCDRDRMRENLTDISHQLKTPLTSMSIMADLLEGEGKQAEFISNIKAGLARMDWLVAALLKMASLDAGVVEFNPAAMSASELVSLALEPLHILFEVKNQSVEVSCGTEIVCDKRWTAEALTNVLKNASEYSPDGGVIRVESGANPICSWVSVTDSGEGLSGADIGRIFKKFEGSRSDKGYGVGLPLALAIVRGQGGDIEVGPDDGGTGAVFTLKFY